MTPLGRTYAPLLLIAFTVGGVLAPPAHRALHAGEAARERVAHAAQGHHHHALAEGHGLEWTAECDDAPLPHALSCVLCHGLSACAGTAAPSVLPLLLQIRPVVAAEVASATAAPGRLLNRGPPRAS